MTVLDHAVQQGGPLHGDPIFPRRQEYDPWLPGLIATLAIFGLVMVYSATIGTAERQAGSSLHFVLRHGFFLAAGLGAMGVVLQMPIRFWEKAGPPLLGLGVLLLMLVLIPGIGGRVNGSARWIPLGIINLQPSEIVKLAMIVYLAGFLVRRQNVLGSFVRGIVSTSCVLALVGGLLMLEPDLGSFIVITFTTFTLLLLAGVRLWHLAIVAGGAGSIMVLLIMAAPYRMARVTGFLDPWADPFGTGFQLSQALIAFGRGEWFGVGLGASVQKLYFLTAAHNDFILSVIAEELGLVGICAVIILIAAFVWRAFTIAARAERMVMLFHARLAAGIGAWLGFQGMVHMGVNMGILPTKGLTLPFVSYGGSSLIVCCIASAILLRIDRETRGVAA